MIRFTSRSYRVAIAALVLLIPVLAAPSAQATSPVVKRAGGFIIGGAPITPAQAPWSVFLYSDNPKTNMEASCGGAILDAVTVVTAAHCLNGVSVGADPTNLGLGVVAGLQNYKSPAGSQQKKVVAARVHPMWKGDINNSSGGDIAVVKLDSPLDLSGPNAKAIALPTPAGSVNGDPIAPPTYSVIEAGYGDQDGASHADGTIHQLPATIVDPDVCSTFAISSATLCAQTPAGTPCHGDSGSALVAPGPTPVILGVVSGGPIGTCVKGNGVAYTSLLTPENRAFVDGNDNPPIAPRQTDFTRYKTTGPFQTGQTLTCFGDNWSNGASTKWVVLNETGAVVASGLGASFNYVFAATDIGHTLACRSYGTNAGGVGVGDRLALSQPITQGPAVPTPGGGSSGGTSSSSSKPSTATGNGMAVVGPVSAARGHTATFKIGFQTIASGSNRIRVTVKVKGKHGTSTSKTFSIPPGSASGSVTMKLKLSKKLSTGTKTFSVTATSYFGKTKTGSPRTLSVKVKVKKK